MFTKAQIQVSTKLVESLKKTTFQIGKMLTWLSVPKIGEKNKPVKILFITLAPTQFIVQETSNNLSTLCIFSSNLFCTYSENTQILFLFIILHKW